MRRYILKRIVYSVVVLFIIATLNFVIFHVVSPIKPYEFYMDPRFTKTARELLRKEFGLDEPLHVQYALYMKNLLKLNFGISFFSRRSVIEDILTYLPNTLLLLAPAMTLTMMLGIPLGLLAASRRGSKTDVSAIGIGLLIYGMPIFLLQLALIYVFSTLLGWFPFGMIVSEPEPQGTLLYIADCLWHLALPLTSLVITGFGTWALYCRNVVLESLTEDYTVTARAKGLKERVILIKYGFRGVLPPIVTVIALAFPGLIMGSIVTERIFSWPGIGTWLIDAIILSDYPSIQAMFLVYAFLMISANFIADILCAVLDPRIRVGAGIRR